MKRAIMAVGEPATKKVKEEGDKWGACRGLYKRGLETLYEKRDFEGAFKVFSEAYDAGKGVCAEGEAIEPKEVYYFLGFCYENYLREENDINKAIEVYEEGHRFGEISCSMALENFSSLGFLNDGEYKKYEKDMSREEAMSSEWFKVDTFLAKYGDKKYY